MKIFCIKAGIVLTDKLQTIKMPQLVPFYFINEVIFAFVLLTIMIYVLSKYILPIFVRIATSRVFIRNIYK